MTAVLGTMVDIPTQDGVADAYLAHPDDNATHPGVLLYMNLFGVRPWLMQMADRIAGAGYTVLVPNVLYRHRRAPLVELPDFIEDADRIVAFEQLVPMMKTLTPDLITRDADAFLSWLIACPRTGDGPVGVTGYCLGAGFALRAAGNYPERVAAAAGFHGGALATDSPDSPHLLAGQITAEVYLGHAENDNALPPAQIERLDKALDAAGVRYHTEVYAGAKHGFTQGDTVVYNAEATERHWTALLDLFGRALN